MKTSWNKIIDEYNNTPPLEDILLFITNNSITTNKPVFPDNYFKCFDYCDIDKIKVVIIGQDPYHGVNQATGLCFAIQENIKIQSTFFVLVFDIPEPHQEKTYYLATSFQYTTRTKLVVYT